MLAEGVGVVLGLFRPCDAYIGGVVVLRPALALDLGWITWMGGWGTHIEKLCVYMCVCAFYQWTGENPTMLFRVVCQECD